MDEGTHFEKYPTPGLVREMLARLGDLPEPARKRWEREFKLSYYFGGQMVAMRPDSGGHVVVAFGPAEKVGAALDRAGLCPPEAERLVISFPDPLDDVIAHLPGRRVAVG